MADEDYQSLIDEQQEHVDQAQEINNGYLDQPQEQEQSNDRPDPEPQQEAPVQEQQRQDFVPQQALHQARLQAKEFKNEMELMRQENERLKAQFEEFNQRQQSSQYDEMDPIERLQNEQQELKAKLSEYDNMISRSQKAQQQQMEQQRELNQIKASYNQAFQQYSAQNTEAREAYDYLQQARLNQMKLMGVSAEDANESLIAEEIQLARNSFNDGVNPFERVFQLAKSFGFQSKLEQQAQVSDQRLNNAARNLERNQNLNSVGGTAPRSSELDVDDYLNMDMNQQNDAQWEKLLKKYS